MDVSLVFIIISAIIAIGFFSNYFFKKTRIPDVIWLIIFGALIGPIFGVIKTEFFINYLSLFSSLALLIILFEGGSCINIYKLIKESYYILFLTILGFAGSMLIVTIISHYFFGFPVMISLLLGAIVGGTSSPIVIPLIQNLTNLKKEVGLILKMESVISDPMTIIVSIVLIETMILSPTEMVVYEILKGLTSLLSISLVIGFFGGIVWASFWHKFIKYKFHYMLTLGFLFLIYVVVEIFGGSGAIAAFMVGLVLGNMPKIKQMFKIKKSLTGLTKETRDFNAYIAFFVRTFFFALIGMIIQISRIDLILYGIIISFAILGIRAFIIRICTYNMHITDNEKNIMTLVYPKGLAAAVLSSLPYIEYKIAGTDVFTEIVFTVIVSTVLISTIGLAILEKRKKKSEGKNKKEKNSNNKN